MQRKIFLAILIGMIIGGESIARAQGTYSATISGLDRSEFPVLSFFLDVNAPGGEFIENLTSQEIQVLEDNQPVAVSQVQEVNPGIEMMVAINAGSALALRDGDGISRYDQIIEVMGYWAGSAPVNSQDSYSLLINQGSSSLDLATPEDLYTAIQTYQPDFRKAVSSADSLSAAINETTTLPDTPGRKRAILFITPIPEDKTLAALPNLREQAVQNGVRIFVWMVDSSDETTAQGAEELANLASSTGGQMLTFTGTEILPDLEDYLRPMRSIYSIKYETSLRSGGDHSLSVRIVLPDGEIDSLAQNFSLDLQPPNPIFVSPPSEIVRTSPEGSQDPLEELSPISTSVQMLVEFPDGITRPITRAALYVDGILMDENTEAPFDQFDWNLIDLTESSQHFLRLEVEDNLEMSGSSIEIPVDVVVELPEGSGWARISNTPILPAAAAGIVVTGSLGLVIFLSNRRKNQIRENKRAALLKKKAAQTAGQQPIPAPATGPFVAAGKLNAQPIAVSVWPKKTVQNPNGATLTPLNDAGEPFNGTSLPLRGPEMTLGQDPTQATCVFNDASLDNLHARLICDAENNWTIFDHGSLAGTRVNYSPASNEGTRLYNGDIIQIGRLSFRFLDARPDRIRNISIQVYEERL